MPRYVPVYAFGWEHDAGRAFMHAGVHDMAVIKVHKKGDSVFVRTVNFDFLV